MERLIEDYLPKGCKDLDELEIARKAIAEDLKNYENFLGVDFCDVSAGGIQIRGHHQLIIGCTFPSQQTIKYDLSNIEEAVVAFCRDWRERDIPEVINGYNAMLSDFKKYGCD